MRLPLIAGNWKMNTTVNEAVELVSQIRKGIGGAFDVEILVCPPFVSLTAVKEALQGSAIKLGAQNLHYEEKGAFTGEVSPLMLAGLCEYVIIGHSERRHIFGETSEIVNKKMGAALKAGLKPVLCIGEKLEDNEAGRTAEVVTEQLQTSLAGINVSAELVVAYEPVWAIGTGRAAHGKQVNETAALVRDVLAKLSSKEIAGEIRVLYGGSVTAENVAEFLEQSEIDGALVGGASLKSGQFITMIQEAEYIYFPNNLQSKDQMTWWNAHEE
ncbi:MAG TPA: triose-phosphate isomerase [Dehalococcoidia bacterium]|nr:triose-phosphate isomerase [Dehalococcoidia bacterium]